MLCRALLCLAMLRALLCLAMLRALLHFLARKCQQYSKRHKQNYPFLGRGRSLNFLLLHFWAVQTSKAAPAAGPFEQLPQLLGPLNRCPRTSKCELFFCN